MLIICVQSLIGAGATRFVMVFKIIFRYLILLPIVYVAVTIIGKGIAMIWVLWAVTDFIETIILITICKESVGLQLVFKNRRGNITIY